MRTVMTLEPSLSERRGPGRCGRTDSARTRSGRRGRALWARKGHGGALEVEVAAPPPGQHAEARAEGEFRESEVLRAQRHLATLQQQETRIARSVDLEADDHRLGRQGVEADAALHVDKQRLEIQVFVVGVPGQPALAPGGERTDQCRQLTAGLGQRGFGPVPALAALDRAGLDQRLQPLGQHRARHPGDAAPDVVEAPAAAEKLAHDEKRPAAAQRLVRARHRTELTVSAHAKTVARGRLARRSGFRTRPSRPTGL